jgi:hypothetical protein
MSAIYVFNLFNPKLSQKEENIILSTKDCTSPFANEIVECDQS